MLVQSWTVEPIWALTKEENLILVSSALVGTLLLGAVIVARIDRWRKRQMSDDDNAPATELGSFRSMYERGELSKEEYDRVLQRIAARAKGKPTAVPPTPAPPVTEPPEQPNGPPPPASA